MKSIGILRLAAVASLVFVCMSFTYEPSNPVYKAEGDNSPDETLVFKEIRTAADNIVVAFFNSDIVDMNGIDISDPSAWKLNGKPAKALNKYVAEADACEHHSASNH